MLAQQKNPEGSVGFANLPDQVYRKSVNRGFEFSLMVMGECGLGKSTLTNSLFLTDLYSPEYPVPSHRIKKTIQVEQSKVLIKEGGVQSLLTIVDIPGFGEAVDNCNCWQPVIDYIDSKSDDYLNAESRVNRRQMPDNRVQCCLHFIMALLANITKYLRKDSQITQQKNNISTNLFYVTSSYNLLISMVFNEKPTVHVTENPCTW
uniref:Septin-type G domain-containing protein n=1 Tax=Cebus imitator TaxID=2715852 RepID=A0A2K5PMT8_CEBIM